MVLRRLSGETSNTAPVLTLITQFGGGKTHTLTALYHLANAGPHADRSSRVFRSWSREAGLAAAPAARVAVFVGNAWDPQPGRETPWIDLARQLAGDKGVEALGAAAATTPPGTEAIGRVFCGGKRASAAAARRSAEFHQPPPRHGRQLLRLPPEPDGGDDRHDPRRRA